MFRRNPRRITEIVSAHIFGSPGPLESTIPSASSCDQSKFQGTRRTSSSRFRRQHKMLYLQPKSTRIIFLLPRVGYHRGEHMLTSATRFRLFGSSQGVSSSSQSNLPSMHPWILSFFVSARVSTPHTAGTPLCFSHESSEPNAAQWLYSRASVETTSPLIWM